MHCLVNVRRETGLLVAYFGAIFHLLLRGEASQRVQMVESSHVQFLSAQTSVGDQRIELCETSL